MRVEHNQIAEPPCTRHVDHPLLEMTENPCAVFRGCDDDGGLSVEKSLHEDSAP